MDKLNQPWNYLRGNQRDQMVRLLVYFLAINNSENLPNTYKIY